MTEATTVPNHHAHYHGCSGVPGWIAGVSMLFGRGDDARLAARLAAIGPGDTLLDVGSGPGVAARLAAKRGAKVTGVDPSTEMRWIAKLTTLPGKVRYRAGSAESLAAPDASVTVYWSLSTIHHWKNVDAGLAEAQRVLAPGGRFVAVEHLIERTDAPGIESHGWTEAQAAAFADLCRAHGFDNVRVEQHPETQRPAISVTAIRR
jgi:ubiquinone/menaquinone biosynthesis C-methylase UbiE